MPPLTKNLSDEIILVSMPFGPLWGPSIALGLLKAELARVHVEARVLYFTIPFAERVGEKLYQQVASGQPATFDLVGEWVFSACLFPDPFEEPGRYIDDVIGGQLKAHGVAKSVPGDFIEGVVAARKQAGAFLDECCATILRRNPKLVGFTSVFQQHAASLALAKRLKARRPELFIVFGGANCEGAMGAETLRQFDFVDAVVSGEGDIVFPKLARRILDDEPLDALDGLFMRNHVEDEQAVSDKFRTRLVVDLDELPTPDYQDFFEQLNASSLKFDVAQINVPFESSRGCWWGQKQHCTFCGLNGDGMAFRSKTAERVLSELTHFNRLYPEMNITAVDNILDLKFFKNLIPALAERNLPLNLFYEVKANLTKEQVRALAQAGIRTIQPGIESFSTHVLALMRKGISGILNIQLLKWCMELGIQASWNIIYGFPGETAEEYGRMADMIPLLTHLSPPEGAGPVRIDRFSPYHKTPERFGYRDLRPFPAYRYIYRLDEEALNNLAYFFEAETDMTPEPSVYVAPLLEQVTRWRRVHKISSLFSEGDGSELRVWDFRPVVSKRVLTRLTGVRRRLYIECDAACSLKKLRQKCDEWGADERDAREALRSLVEDGLMIREDETYLSLAIPLGDYSPDPSILEEFMRHVKELARRPVERAMSSPVM